MPGIDWQIGGLHAGQIRLVSCSSHAAQARPGLRPGQQSDLLLS